MSSDAPEQGPTEEEVQLGLQAQSKYDSAKQLRAGGVDYLLNTINEGSVGRDAEKSNAQNAVAFSRMPDSTEETMPADLREFSGGLLAAEAQNDADNASTVLDLAGTNVGTMARNSSAAYAEGQREMAVNAAQAQRDAQNSAWIPSLAGNAIGMYAGGGFDHWMSENSPYNSTNAAKSIKGLLPTKKV